MILPIQHTVRGRLIEAVGRLYSIPPDDPALAPIAIEMPPRRALGDLAVPLAFELARRLRKAPRAIAQEIAGALGAIEGFASRRGGAQRLRQFLPRPPGRAHALAGRRPGVPVRSPARKTIVEHTAINPNKAAHIGHLRNAALGDAFGRLLRFLGRTVEIQNYIDDTGVQVADVAVGFRELERKSLDEVRADRRRRPLRLLLLGSVRARHRVVRRGQGAARRSAPRRSTTSSTAATTPPTSRTSSPIASSAAI